jgi:hypothetical protein
MCDYSLHTQPNRLAVEGEKLVLVRFPGGSLGFASRKEAEERSAGQPPRTRPRFDWSWQSICAMWSARKTAKPAAPMTAVCIAPGACLQLDGIPAHTQRSFGVSAAERVTFTQLGFEPYTYRDAIRFSNGKEVLLQHLPEKQTATVLSLYGDSTFDPEQTRDYELSRS